MDLRLRSGCFLCVTRRTGPGAAMAPPRYYTAWPEIHALRAAPRNRIAPVEAVSSSGPHRGHRLGTAPRHRRARLAGEPLAGGPAPPPAPRSGPTH